jgi:hypothetical protein
MWFKWFRRRMRAEKIRECIERYPLPDGFVGRLARENGWSLDYALRVVVEYRRFLYLISVNGPGTPSKRVDTAWHLHLIATRSYRGLERELGFEIDHDPGFEGSVEEAAFFDRQYLTTLERYYDLFGEDPPADIWGYSLIKETNV